MSSIIKTSPRRAKKIFVYYNTDNGAVTDIVFAVKDTGSYIEVETSHPVIADIQSKKIKLNHCIVAYDKKTEAMNITYKGNVIRQLRNDNVLQVIDELPEFDSAVQVLVSVFNLDKTIEISLNQSALGNIVNSTGTLASDVSYLEIWVTDVNDPNKLYGKLKCSMIELLQTGHVLIQAPWWSSTLRNKIKFLTKKVFVSYGWVFNELDTKPPYKSNSKLTIHSARKSSSDDCNVKIKITKNRAIITSYISNPDKYKIFDCLNIYLIKNNDPSQYIGKISIPNSSIYNGAEFSVGYESVPDNIGLIYDNNFVTINYSIEQV
jgi:hypothetical protein